MSRVLATWNALSLAVIVAALTIALVFGEVERRARDRQFATLLIQLKAASDRDAATIRSLRCVVLIPAALRIPENVDRCF